MYHLASVFPPIRKLGRLPLSRDQVMLLMVAVNEIFLGVDHYLAHLISGTIRPYEMIPIVFGPVAGVLVLAAGVIALRWRTFASAGITLVLSVSIVIGLLGWCLHFFRAILPYGPAGERVTIELLIWAPPFLGPLTASLVGLLGIIAAWRENPPDSGAIELSPRWRVQLPCDKAHAYFLLVGLGTLATLISSVLDHARTGFVNTWLWVPVVIGVFGTVVGVSLGFIRKPSRVDLTIFILAMLLLIAVGVIGAGLHLREDYILGGGLIVPERFIRGAPFLAPLLFSDMGALGLVALLDPRERRE